MLADFNWQRDPANPVLPPTAERPEESARCMNPFVVRVGDEYLRVECPDGKGSLELGGRQDFAVDPRARVLRASP